MINNLDKIEKVQDWYKHKDRQYIIVERDEKFYSPASIKRLSDGKTYKLEYLLMQFPFAEIIIDDICNDYTMVSVAMRYHGKPGRYHIGQYPINDIETLEVEKSIGERIDKWLKNPSF